MNYTLVQGDSKVIDIPMVDDEGAPFDLAGVTVIVTAKSSVDDTDEEALFQHRASIDSNGDIEEGNDSIYLGTGGASAGIMFHRIDPDESVTWTPGTYQYDVQVSYPSPDVVGEIDTETKITGTLTVTASITQAVVAP